MKLPAVRGRRRRALDTVVRCSSGHLFTDELAAAHQHHDLLII